MKVRLGQSLPEKGTPLADCPYVVSVLSIPAIAIKTVDKTKLIPFFKIHAIDGRRGEPQVARPLPVLMYSKHIENWYNKQVGNSLAPFFTHCLHIVCTSSGDSG